MRGFAAAAGCAAASARDRTNTAPVDASARLVAIAAPLGDFFLCGGGGATRLPERSFIAMLA